MCTFRSHYGNVICTFCVHFLSICLAFLSQQSAPFAFYATSYRSKCLNFCIQYSLWSDLNAVWWIHIYLCRKYIFCSIMNIRNACSWALGRLSASECMYFTCGSVRVCVCVHGRGQMKPKCIQTDDEASNRFQ